MNTISLVPIGFWAKKNSFSDWFLSQKKNKTLFRRISEPKKKKTLQGNVEARKIWNLTKSQRSGFESRLGPKFSGLSHNYQRGANNCEDHHTLKFHFNPQFKYTNFNINIEKIYVQHSMHGITIFQSQQRMDGLAFSKVPQQLVSY